MNEHETWMHISLQEAQKAFAKKEVPVGAIIVQEGRIISRGHNLIETLQDPTAHAETLVISAAANAVASWRLDDSILYTTLEPCAMCVGAALLSRIPTIIYGAKDPRYGACGSVLQIANNDKLDISAEVISGILEEECSQLIKNFFKEIRHQN
jgi:tRNA(adenine34) deaminase